MVITHTGRESPAAIGVARVLQPGQSELALRLLSWNLLHKTGACCGDVARLLELHRPDVALFQEASHDLDDLTGLLGGSYARFPMVGRHHGPAAWSRHRLKNVESVQLPPAGKWDLPSPVFKQAVGRVALVAEILDVMFATVHLDHGQLANRRQFAHLIRVRPGLSIVAGDFNAVGPVLVPGFLDVGPRTVTHTAWGVVPLRLDRCLVRGMRVTGTMALDRGRSDHRPIVVDLVSRQQPDPP